MGKLKLKSKHRLLCGDATKKEDVVRLMDGQKADICTDPPYNINQPIRNDNLTEEEAILLHRNFIKNLPIEDNATAIVFHSPRTFVMAIDAFRDNKWLFGRALWMHEQGGHAYDWHCWYMTGDIILVFLWGKGSFQKRLSEGVVDTYTHKIGKGSNEQGIRPGEKVDKTTNALYHPTLKPLWIVLDLINHLKNKNIFDPFIGSGSTLIACEKTKRKCYGMEIDPHYCDVAVKRWEDYTGEKAVLNG